MHFAIFFVPCTYTQYLWFKCTKFHSSLVVLSLILLFSMLVILKVIFELPERSILDDQLLCLRASRCTKFEQLGLSFQETASTKTVTRTLLPLIFCQPLLLHETIHQASRLQHILGVLLLDHVVDLALEIFLRAISFLLRDDDSDDDSESGSDID